MSGHWTDRLSEYIDGELGAAERARLEAHLGDCAECRATLVELRAVAARASSLADRPPSADLWSGIAARIAGGAGAGSSGRDAGSEITDLRERRRRGRRLAFSMPELVAAGIALAVVSGAAGWVVASRGSEPAPGASAARTTPVARTVGVGPRLVSSSPRASFAQAQYTHAIADLERVLQERRPQLHPETVRVIEENLLVIDRAIDEARRALLLDPESDYLNQHLANNMRRKLEFLRRATSIDPVGG